MPQRIPPPPYIEHVEVSAGERDTEPHWPDHAQSGQPQLPPGFALPAGVDPEVQYGPEPGFGGYGPQPEPTPFAAFEPQQPEPSRFAAFGPPPQPEPPQPEPPRFAAFEPPRPAVPQPALPPSPPGFFEQGPVFDTRQPPEPQPHPEMWEHREQWQREQSWQHDRALEPAEPDRLPAAAAEPEEKAPRRIPALLIAAIVSVLLVGVAVWTQWPKDVRGASPARPGTVASDATTAGPAAEGSTPLPAAPSDSASPAPAPAPSTTTKKATPTPTPTPRARTTTPVNNQPSPSPSTSSSSPSPSPSESSPSPTP